MKNFKFILAFILGILTFYFFDIVSVPYDELGKPNPPILWPWPGERQTLLSLSPNNAYRVSTVYHSEFWESYKTINFYLHSKHGAKQLFIVTIEGNVGSENIIWNKSGNQFILLGRKFRKNSGKIPDYAIDIFGNTMYIVYNIDNQRMYCHGKTLGSNLCYPLSKEILKNFKND